MGAEAEHGEGDEGLWSVEPERNAGDEPDLVVGRFDQRVRQSAVEGGVDRCAVFDDASLQVDFRTLGWVLGGVGEGVE